MKPFISLRDYAASCCESYFYVKFWRKLCTNYFNVEILLSIFVEWAVWGGGGGRVWNRTEIGPKIGDLDSSWPERFPGGNSKKQLCFQAELSSNFSPSDFSLSLRCLFICLSVCLVVRLFLFVCPPPHSPFFFYLNPKMLVANIFPLCNVNTLIPYHQYPFPLPSPSPLP